MKKANCGASMKPQQKSTPKMAMGGMMDRKAPQSVQAMTAQSSAGARRQQRKYN